MDFNKIIEIIQEFDGIIGTLLGVVVTLIATDFLRKKGKLHLYIKKADGYFYYQNIIGERTSNKENSNLEIDGYKFNLSLDVYNESDIPKVIRNIGYEVYVDNDLLTNGPLMDENSRIHTSYSTSVTPAKIFNIEPKKAEELKLSFNLNYQNASDLKDKKVILKLKYTNEKNKINYFEFYNDIIEENEEDKFVN